MYSIKNNLENTIIIKKSKFIGKIFFVNNKDEAMDILNSIKNKYTDSTHICYCYIIDNIIKFSDDNEPSNTAGMPIYNVLKNNNLNHVLAIVIRYFGGIKLGAGGLVRAYSNCVNSLVKENIIELKDGYRVLIKFNYDKIKDIEYILSKVNIIEKKYNEDISIIFDISIDDYTDIKNKLHNIVNNIEIIDKIFIN